MKPVLAKSFSLPSHLKSSSGSKFSGNKLKTASNCVFVLFFAILGVLSLQNLLIFQKIRWTLGLGESTHMFVISAFYYNQSRSLPSNTIAVIFSARKNLLDFPITCISKDKYGNERKSLARMDMALVAPVQCKWTTMIALCPAITEPKHLELEGDPGSKHVIPFKPVDNKKRNFVVCMSRMFLFENWQLLISSLEIYRFYGADLMVTYVESVLTNIHQMLKAYESEGFLALRPAVRLFKPDDLNYDPNEENEWYNQDFSYNSCLYEFKESAEYLMIADWDDVLVPEHHNNYFKEMQWLNTMHPGAAAFIFERPQSTLHTSHSPLTFSLSKTINNVQVNEEEVLTGKFVGQPSRIDGIWLHAPSRVKRPYEVVKLGPQFSRVYHFRKWSFDEITTELKNRTYLAKETEVEENFVGFLDKYNLTSAFLSLPSVYFYYNTLVDCYNRFATLLDKHSFGCPSLPKCDLPLNVPVKCTVLKHNYQSTALLKKFYIHQSANDEFIDKESGCSSW